MEIRVSKKELDKLPRYADGKIKAGETLNFIKTELKECTHIHMKKIDNDYIVYELLKS